MMKAALMNSATRLAWANDLLSSMLRKGVENWKHCLSISSRKTWKYGTASAYASVNSRRTMGSAQ
jgi:hypothetical protein